MNLIRSFRYAALLFALGLAPMPIEAARTQVKRGVNVFSTGDDVEMGREAATEAEKSLVLLDDPALNEYVSAIGKRVASVSLEPGFPYRFKLVNSSEINAFALPGGFIYVNRGVLERADNEAELAGVLAHEVGHAAARHGTNQLTKRVLVSVPLALVTGVAIKDDSGWAAGLARLGIELGATGLFMSYSRKAESQADLLATQSLHDLGYDPQAMATFFAKLQKEHGRSPGKLERFFASHPVPENREKQVSQEVARLGPARAEGLRRDDGTFARMKARLTSLPPPPEPRAAGGDAGGRDRGQGSEKSRVFARSEVPRPSRRWLDFRSSDRKVAGTIPDNWRAVDEGSRSYRLGPVQGFDSASGNLTYGMRIHLIAKSVGQKTADLESALDSELQGLLRAQVGYRERRRSREIIELDGMRAARTVIAGPASDAEGEYEELVAVLVRPQREPDEQPLLVVIYLVSPKADEAEWGRAFDEVLASLRLP